MINNTKKEVFWGCFFVELQKYLQINCISKEPIEGTFHLLRPKCVQLFTCVTVIKLAYALNNDN